MASVFSYFFLKSEMSSFLFIIIIISEPFQAQHKFFHLSFNLLLPSATTKLPLSSISNKIFKSDTFCLVAKVEKNI